MHETAETLREQMGVLPDHRSKADIETMAGAIRSLEGEQRIRFAALLIEFGLMVVQEDDGDPATGMLKMAFMLAREQGATVDVLMIIEGATPGFINSLVDGSADHCVNGTDLTDPTSAGGWNEAETVAVNAALYTIRGDLSVPYGVERA